MISFATHRPASHQAAIAGALALLMVATRVHPVGAWLHLPNGSDAVFFLAGLLLASPWFLVVFMAAAALIDTVGFLHGQSAWCVTVAYGALVLGYTALWTAGRWAARQEGSPAWMALALGGVAWLGHSLAFVISNGAYYWLSGRYTDPNLAQYLARFVRYYPMFVGTAWAFSAAGTIIYGIVARIDGARKITAQYQRS